MKNNVAECLKESFEKYGEEIAIQHEERILTYSELDLLSNKVANYLIINSIGNGDIVAVKMNRSIEMIIAIIGIIKSGAAYMPIAHSFPKK